MLRDKVSTVGETTSDYAKRFGCATADFAKRVGPKRGMIALGVIAAAVGAAFLTRLIRSRRAEAMGTEGEHGRVRGVREREVATVYVPG